MRGTRERKQKTKKETKIRIYSRSEKKDKRQLNNYAIRIIIISLYDIFNSIGFIYKYYFNFWSYHLHKLYQGPFWRILSAKLAGRIINSSDGSKNKNKISQHHMRVFLADYSKFFSFFG